MDTSKAFRPAIGKFGPKHDYRGAHVMMEYQGRTLLGELKEIRYDEHGAPGFRCDVQHFNGDAWPMVPALNALWILDRAAA